MSRIPHALIAFGTSAVSLYAAQKSYIAITNLQRYEERSEKAAKHSETAAHELYKTRITQGSSAVVIALSLLASVSILLRALFGSPNSPAWEYASTPLMLVAIAAAFVHNQNYWKAKAKVPFVGCFNEGVQKSKEIRQLLIVLGLAWGAIGVYGWIEG
ncbi:MAG: hypothetical protein Q9182_004867 [Xanthomendoza sp. 2 TL-2023]